MTEVASILNRCSLLESASDMIFLVKSLDLADLDPSWLILLLTSIVTLGREGLALDISQKLLSYFNTLCL
jgi:hypothetical protein